MISMLSMIFAHATNGVIGKDNKIPWYCPEDLAFFKERTTGHHIIMGRKTFESFSKPLPNRVHVILTRDKDYKVEPQKLGFLEDIIVVHSKEEALEVVKNDPEPFVIGGAEIYDLFLDDAYRVYRTLICKDYEGDTKISDRILEKCVNHGALIGKAETTLKEGEEIIKVKFHTHQLRLPMIDAKEIMNDINNYFGTDYESVKDIIKVYQYAKKERAIENRLLALNAKPNPKLEGLDDFIAIMHNTIYTAYNGNFTLDCPRVIDKPSLFNLPEGEPSYNLKDLVPMV